MIAEVHIEAMQQTIGQNSANSSKARQTVKLFFGLEPCRLIGRILSSRAMVQRS